MRCRRFKENNKNSNQSIRQCGNKAREPALKSWWTWKSGHEEEGQVASLQYLPTSHEGSEEHREVAKL